MTAVRTRGELGEVGWWVDAGARALRQAAADRLASLDELGELSSEHVRLSAAMLGVAERTVWRWLAARRGGVGPMPRRRFRLDDGLRVRLAYWRGNVMALHRELVEVEKAGGAPAPSKSALYRAVVADVSIGDRAGLGAGERARRRFDVFLRRPASFRNAAWEADHVEAPVQVEADGRLVKPWVTWFVDAAHDVILGVAVTPRTPNRESVLAALRAAVMRREPTGRPVVCRRWCAWTVARISCPARSPTRWARWRCGWTTCLPMVRI